MQKINLCHYVKSKLAKFTQMTSEVVAVSEVIQLVVKKALSKHENPVPCPVCGRMMKNQRGINGHMSKMHK
ncbi:unnamed protein product [Brachionus calyciflorus]|uniref:C2H2-type domain-containing protein n=1 Tax=Brachionus calyciflorus TaxID=104777 RepID=A0A813U123_9BILA|nr:unnamed protein product [Brachionus calyciflorus]